MPNLINIILYRRIRLVSRSIFQTQNTLYTFNHKLKFFLWKKVSKKKCAKMICKIILMINEHWAYNSTSHPYSTLIFGLFWNFYFPLDELLVWFFGAPPCIRACNTHWNRRFIGRKKFMMNDSTTLSLISIWFRCRSAAQSRRFAWILPVDFWYPAMKTAVAFSLIFVAEELYSVLSLTQLTSEAYDSRHQLITYWPVVMITNLFSLTCKVWHPLLLQNV